MAPNSELRRDAVAKASFDEKKRRRAPVSGPDRPGPPESESRTAALPSALSVRRARGVLALLAICVTLLLPAALPMAAQDEHKGPALKTVHGTVLNKNDDPLPEAVVFLKNLQNGSIKTYIADAEAGYRFSGLDPNVDYEIHAEFKGDSSPVKRLSSLDGRKDIHLNLVIPHKK